MNIKMIKVSWGLLLISALAQAQQRFANTIEYDSTKMILSPAALHEFAWLAGHWRGEAFGGITEEVWTPPLGGSMMCVFKVVINDKTSFYEIVTLSESKGTVEKRLRHFSTDLWAWEEKNSPQKFKLIKVTDNRIYFDGFTYERISEHEMNIYAILKQRDGTKVEVKFNYKRYTQ
jgi:hypothetical protein